VERWNPQLLMFANVQRGPSLPGAASQVRRCQLLGQDNNGPTTTYIYSMGTWVRRVPCAALVKTR
jgi:hypothetical protein